MSPVRHDPLSPVPQDPSAIPVTASRPWHTVWPAHVPVSRSYPSVPAWRLLEQSADRFPDRVAVRTLDHDTLAEGGTLTYAQLFRAAQGVAAGLARLGVSPGDRVGVCLPNSPELILGFYGTWMASGVVAPANWTARAPELASQFTDASVAVILGVASTPVEAVARGLGVPFVSLEALRALESIPPGPMVEPAHPDEDLAVLLYTGGTTGVPKGAMLTHRNIVANTIQFAEWYAFEPGAETMVSVIPMFHSGGMSGAMNVPLSAGATLLTLPRFNAPAVARAIERYRATRFFGVPTMFIGLLDCEAGRRCDYGSLRACRTNGASLPPTVKTAFDSLVGREVLVEGYGLTETSPLAHANPIGRAKAGSIGIPIADTDATIVDVETGGDVRPGGPGELLIRGPQVMRGYWRRPEDTADAMRGGWLHTGDIATMDADGYFAIVDRKKDVINTAGFKVWPREVEEVMYGHEAVKVVAVVGVTDAYRGEAVKACVVLKEGYRGRVSERALLEFCKARLTTYKVPRQIEFRDELPMSGAGKLLRRALRENASVP